MLDRLSADVASALRSLAAAPDRVFTLGFASTGDHGVAVIGLTGAVVIVMAILATWVPAVAASRADPNMLLRAE